MRRLPIVLAVLGVLADAATTQWCWSAIPRCEEGNPVSVTLFDLVPGGLWVVALLICAAAVGAGWPLWTRVPLSRGVVVVTWVALLLFAASRFWTAAENWHLVVTHL